MDTPAMVSIASVAIGVLGLLFGVYKHFSTRKIARVVYEISQIADYDVPASFLTGVPKAPVMVSIESVGTKWAENVVLHLKTRSRISNHNPEPHDLKLSVGPNDLTLTIAKFNPSQKVKLFLDCDGSASEDQIELMELSHSEGMGINKRSSTFTTVTFRFLFSEFELDLLSSQFHLRRLGPWVLR